jgi:hypothetical protein
MWKTTILALSLSAAACMHLAERLPYQLSSRDCQGEAGCEEFLINGGASALLNAEIPDRSYIRSLIVVRQGDPEWGVYAVLKTSATWHFVYCLDGQSCHFREELEANLSHDLREALSSVFESVSVAEYQGRSKKFIAQHPSPLLLRRCVTGMVPICESRFFPRGDTTSMSLLYLLWD